jgi:hypothetical protein
MLFKHRWPGLPDFSWYSIPNREKYIPGYHKIYQMAKKFTSWMQTIPNEHKIYQHPLLQDPPKLIENGIFLFENTPSSGNPATVSFL